MNNKTGARSRCALARGSAAWLERGNEIIAGINETIQRLRDLGRDAAQEGDIETGWFCDKQIKFLERKIAETEATISKHTSQHRAQGEVGQPNGRG